MIVKKYSPASPTVEAFHRCDAPMRALVGAVGTAKTTTALWEIGFNLPSRIYNMYGIAHTKWFVVRKTYGELMDTDFETAVSWFIEHDWHFTSKNLTLQWPARENCKSPLTVELLFRACNTPDTEEKFRSFEVTGAWIDEAIEVHQHVKNIIKGRLGRFPKRKDSPCDYVPRYMIETTNPCSIDHPMYWMYDWMGPGKKEDGTWDTGVLVPKRPPGPLANRAPIPGYVGFWQEQGENKENLREGYWEDIARDYPESPEMVSMMVEGKPGHKPEGKGVYRNFDMNVHMAQAPLIWMKGADPRTGHLGGVPLYAGWDNTGNSPACIIGQRTGPFAFQALREYHDLRMGIVDFTKWVLSDMQVHFPGNFTTHYCDPAAFNKMSDARGGLTSNAQMQMELCGIKLIPSRQELDVRLNAVDQLLARRGGFLADPSCTRLLNGFQGGYVYEENPRMGMSEFKADPKKNLFSHIHDALQYVVVMLFYPDMKAEARESVANRIIGNQSYSDALSSRGYDDGQIVVDFDSRFG